MRLSDIAEIKIGYNFKRVLISLADNEEQPVGVTVIQPCDVAGFCCVDAPYFQKVQLIDVKDKYFLSVGEILLSNKGNIKATVWCGKEKIMASSAFYRIQLVNKTYLPEFVAIYLNSQVRKAKLNLRQNTERVSTITISDVAQIDIPLVPLDKQKRIVELYALYEKEVDILENIKIKRKRLVNSILSKIVKE